MLYKIYETWFNKMGISFLPELRSEPAPSQIVSQLLDVGLALDIEKKFNNKFIHINVKTDEKLFRVVESRSETNKRRIVFEKEKLDALVLLHAASNGDIETIQLLLQEYHSKLPDLRLADNEGYTAIHFAVRNGHTEVAQLLIETDKTLLDLKDRHDNGLLHLAARKEFQQHPLLDFLVKENSMADPKIKLHMVKLLLNNNADAWTYNLDQQTPLDAALEGLRKEQIYLTIDNEHYEEIRTLLLAKMQSTKTQIQNTVFEKIKSKCETYTENKKLLSQGKHSIFTGPTQSSKEFVANSATANPEKNEYKKIKITK